MELRLKTRAGVLEGTPDVVAQLPAWRSLDPVAGVAPFRERSCLCTHTYSIATGVQSHVVRPGQPNNALCRERSCLCTHEESIELIGGRYGIPSCSTDSPAMSYVTSAAASALTSDCGIGDILPTVCFRCFLIPLSNPKRISGLF